MVTNIIRAWELSQSGAREVNLPDMSTLDALTRQLPQGLYTTFRTYQHGKAVLGLRAHLARLYSPSAVHQCDPAVSPERLRQDLAYILQNYPDEARVRLILTENGQVYFAIEPLKLLPLEIYLQGVKVVTTRVGRHNPRLKSTSFISDSQSTRKKIAESHIFEALLVRNGRILEGMTSNFFYVQDGKVGTARRDILLGVTRRTVLRVVRGRGLGIVYRPLRLEQVPALEEAFITSSSREIVPVVQIDARAVGEGRPGPVTGMLMKGYKTFVLQKAETIDPC